MILKKFLLPLLITGWILFDPGLSSCVKQDVNQINGNLMINQSFAFPFGTYTLGINPPSVDDTSSVSGLFGTYYYNNYPYPNSFEWFPLPQEMISFHLGDTIYESFIKSIDFALVINNSFPTQLTSQIYMVDSSMLLIDQLFSSNSLQIAPSVVSVQQIPMSASQINNLKHTRYLLFQGIVSTTNTGSHQSVYFNSNNSVTITVGVNFNVQYPNKDL